MELDEKHDDYQWDQYVADMEAQGVPLADILDPKSEFNNPTLCQN
jgi:hypothetical protein